MIVNMTTTATSAEINHIIESIKQPVKKVRAA